MILQNLGFDQGWVDITGSRQQPDHWTIGYLAEGAFLWGSRDQAVAEPEMVHKVVDLATGEITLPPEEWKDGIRPLILDGRAVYKVFHAQHAFGGWLRQDTALLVPGTEFQIVVPIQMHQQGSLDPWGAEFGIRLNGGDPVWINFGTAEDRKWKELTASIVVPASGVVTVELLFKSKWGKFDFFVDAMRVQGQLAGGSTPTPPPVTPPTPPPTVPVPIPTELNAAIGAHLENIGNSYVEIGRLLQGQ